MFGLVHLICLDAHNSRVGGEQVLYTQIELFKLLRENRFHEARPLAEYLSLVVANIRIQ